MIVQANSAYMPLEDESVHCAVTSIPYWGLRDYGLEPQIWGGRRDCQHEWGNPVVRPALTGGTNQGSKSDNKDGCTYIPVPESESAFCIHCGAWRGSLGLEPTLDLFIANIVSIFREVWRVLRDDGTLWLNIGDTFATSSNGRSAAATKATGNDDRTFRDKPFSTVGNGLKAKDLCMVPARVALALQADGWYLRSEIVWHKPNPMPESVTDRPTKAHEMVYLLTKRERYYYDAEAVRQPLESDPSGWGRHSKKDPGLAAVDPRPMFGPGRNGRNGTEWGDGNKRNLRSVWTIATEPYPAAHYATFPTKLVEPCILAGSSARGCCPKCGAGWVRVVERVSASVDNPRSWQGVPEFQPNRGNRGQFPKKVGAVGTPKVIDTGWRPGCGCGCAETVPAVILDPFCGSGTTGYVAHRLGRRFVGLDLSPVYLAENALPRAEGKTSQKAIETLPLFLGLTNANL